MTAPQSPQARPNGPRRPRAWLARRTAAVLSVVAMLGLGGLMYWNDQQGTANATQAAATSSSASGSGSTASPNRSDRERGEGDGEHESDDEGEGDGGSSIVDDIASLVPGLSGNSGSSSTSTGGTSQQQTVPAPHTSTRGS